MEIELASESKLNARQVADFLVKAINKDEALVASKGVTIRDLLRLATPLVSCHRERFAQFEEWRDLFSGPEGNACLLNYVDRHIKLRFNTCANDIDEVFSSASGTANHEGVCSKRITKYAKTIGEEEDSQEVTVKNFLDANILNEQEKQQFIKRCALLEPRVRENLSYFIQDNKKISAYLANLKDTKEALLYKRCKVVNRMFRKH